MLSDLILIVLFCLGAIGIPFATAWIYFTVTTPRILPMVKVDEDKAEEAPDDERG